MKQLVQNLRTGRAEVIDVPAPAVPAGFVCVEVGASIVSAGTERMIVEFGSKNLLQKARARPDLARQVLQKLRRDGLASTMASVQARLDQPVPLGYAASGEVVAVGEGAPFRVGERVACAGAGYAVHAEIIAVPMNLVARVPDGVGDEEAAFATLGAVALHGVRLADPRLGETAVVIGLGLLGQLTVQLLKASGCRVAAMDPDARRSELAGALGADVTATTADALAAAVQGLSGGRGADCVLIAAETPSNEPVELAAAVARDRAAVVAVGAVGLTLPRKPYFDKELSFRVSRSYGPGRYDPEYELHGHDYPIGFVRWTEQRNLEAFLQLVAEKRVTVASLITHRLPIARGVDALDLVSGKTGDSFLGVVLEYPGSADRARHISRSPLPQPVADSRDSVSVAVLGAGLFATTTLLPAMKEISAFKLHAVGASTGASAQSAAKRFGVPLASTSEADIINNPAVDLVAIATPHSQHARQVVAALDSGKHVFVEKPPCLTLAELAAIEQAWDAAARGGRPRTLMVGFNRRWAPMVVELRSALRSVKEPLMLTYRVNAGYLPPTHWTQSAGEGGRLVGEGCHFIDLLIDLAGSPVRLVSTKTLPDVGRYSRDNFVVTLEFENGSLGSLTYVANGHSAAGKERLEVTGGGLMAQLEDFRTLRIDRPGGSLTRKARLRQDKGHRGEWEALLAWMQGRAAEPLPFEQVRHTMRVVLAAAESLAAGGAALDPMDGA